MVARGSRGKKAAPAAYPGSPLLEIADWLTAAASAVSRVQPVRIPEVWDSIGYDGPERRETGSGEILVNPYRFYGETIRRQILPHRRDGVNYLVSLAEARSREDDKRSSLSSDSGGVDGGSGSSPGQRRAALRDGSVYALLVHLTTAWDHDGDGYLLSDPSPYGRETGTFLKSITLLPILRRLGVRTVLLLPIMERGSAYRKGDLGSPYAVQDLFSLDAKVAESLLSAGGFSVEDEFRAFVEAAHVLGMRVLIDVVLRTASRDASMLREHPDWFYWIEIRYLDSYAAPPMKDVPFGPLPPSMLGRVHETPGAREHLRKFTQSPDLLDPARWETLVSDPALLAQDLLGAIEHRFHITTAPAFTHWVNDPQPTWSDVTPLRLFRDNPQAAREHIGRDQVPYVLHDSLNAADFPGEEANEELWRLLASVIPAYQDKFGIDGARLDLASALPRVLQRRIVQEARARNPSFLLLSEELDHRRAALAEEVGFDAIVGNVWWYEARWHLGSGLSLLQEVLPSLGIPALGTAETPDTPRAACRVGAEPFAELAIAANHFLPNVVPFVATGAELLERDPINPALDAEPGLLRAECRHLATTQRPALFNVKVLPWASEQARTMIAFLSSLARERSRLHEFLCDEAPAFLPTREGSQFVLAWLYRHPSELDQILVVLANVDLRRAHQVLVTLPPPWDRGQPGLEDLFAVSGRRVSKAQAKRMQPKVGGLDVHLENGEILIARLKFSPD